MTYWHHLFTGNCLRYLPMSHDTIHTRMSHGTHANESWYTRKWWSFMWIPWLIHMWVMTHSRRYHDSFICGSRLIHVWKHKSLVCVPEFIRVWDMAHSYVGHDSCMCVSGLIRVCSKQLIIWESQRDSFPLKESSETSERVRYQKRPGWIWKELSKRPANWKKISIHQRGFLWWIEIFFWSKLHSIWESKQVFWIGLFCFMRVSYNRSLLIYWDFFWSKHYSQWERQQVSLIALFGFIQVSFDISCGGHICIHIHIYVCMYVYICTSLWIYVYIYVYTYIYKDIQICMYTYIFVCTHMYICMYTCKYIYILWYVYIYYTIHIHIYWYMCACIYARGEGRRVAHKYVWFRCRA